MRTRSSPHGREVLRVKKGWATVQAGQENGAQAGLGYVHINGTYKPIMNCHGVLVRGMKFDPWICDGFTIAGFDVGPWEIGPYDIDTLSAGKVHIHYRIEYHNEGYQILGPAKNIDGPPIIRLVTLDPGEWKKLLGTLRTWCVILVLFLLLFLISVWQGGGLALPPF